MKIRRAAVCMRRVKRRRTVYPPANLRRCCWRCVASAAPADLSTLRAKDLALAHACAQGNEKAWECFIALYREKLYRTAEALTRDELKASRIG